MDKIVDDLFETKKKRKENPWTLRSIKGIIAVT